MEDSASLPQRIHFSLVRTESIEDKYKYQDFAVDSHQHEYTMLMIERAE